MEISIIEVLRDLAGQYTTRVIVNSDIVYIFVFANYPSYDQIVESVMQAENFRLVNNTNGITE